jgi:hypothetical protein
MNTAKYSPKYFHICEYGPYLAFLPEGDAADDVQHGGSSGWSIGSERWNNAFDGFEPAPPQRANAERGGAVPCRPLCRSRSRGRAIDPCPVDRPHPFW